MRRRSARSHLLFALPLLVACGAGDGDRAGSGGTTGQGGNAGAGGGTTSTTGVGTGGSGGSTGAGGAGGSGGGQGMSTPCWPFDAPPIEALRASPKKVFAHYFSPYPLSLDDKPPDQDYYAVNYLQPTGESSKFAYCGGFIKERPLPQPPRADASTYESENLKEEVRRAAAIGLDGFTFDILNHTGKAWDRLLKLLDAAHDVDPGFRIVLMPDMTSTYTGDDATAQADFVDSISSVATHPAVFHVPEGPLLLAPFAADKRTPAWWASTLAALSAKGVDAVLWPVFVSPWSTSTKSLQQAVPLYGTSSWGPATVPGATNYAQNSANAHGMSLRWMSPVRSQDSRPKDLVYSEPDDSRTLRLLWDAARQGDADWVQLVTWNDYSEATEISPSSGTQWALFDLTAYETAWYKTGVQPAIVRDAIYYFHRSQSTSAEPDLMKQSKPYQVVNGAPPADEIELLAFLTAPATLQIEIGGAVQSMDAPAGIQSFRVPLAEGTPTFRIVRDGATVASVESALPISNQITYQDMLYRAGGSLACDRSALMQ